MFVADLILAAGLLFQSATVDPATESLRRTIEEAGIPAVIQVGGDRVFASRALPGFYERRAFAPAWSRQGRLLPRARRLIDFIVSVDGEGLRPDDYHLEALRERLADWSEEPRRVAGTDLLLTDAFLILAAHFVEGRVDPATFDPSWIAVRREVDVVAVLEGVVTGEPLADALAALRPQHAGFSIYAYLRTIPPVDNLVPDYEEPGGAEGYPVH